MNDRVFNNRYRFLVVVFIFFFILLFFSFFKVMIIDNKKYSKLVDELSNKVIYGDSAPRGRILDRNYNIIVDNEKIILSARGGNGVELNIDKEIEISNLTLLAQIINEKGICNWNGFDEKNDQVLDGNSFKLEVVYSDAKTLKANGYMKYPENYNIGHEALVEFFGKFN